MSYGFTVSRVPITVSGTDVVIYHLWEFLVVWKNKRHVRYWRGL